MSKVSALISAYYAEKYLETRLVNLFNADTVNIEPIVICQEGSVEDKIASQYELKIIRTPDIPTIGKAWNLGINQSSGEYITTANTDDRYHENGLQRMVDVLDFMPEIGLVFSQVDVEHRNYITPWKRVDFAKGEVRNIKGVLKSRCIIGPMPLWRRSIHEMVGYFRDDYKVASDYDMWLRMARADVRFYYIPQSLGVYMKRNDSLEHRNKQISRIESLEVQA